MAADLIDTLGQQAPAAGVGAVAYAAPAGRVAVLSAIVVANTGAATTYRVHVCPTAAAAAVGNAIAYDVAIAANATHTYPPGITLGATGNVRVQSASGAVTFTVCGEETDTPT